MTWRAMSARPEAKVESEMERLRVESEDLRAGQAALAAELERKFIEQNTKLKKEYERKLEDMKRAATEAGAYTRPLSAQPEPLRAQNTP